MKSRNSNIEILRILATFFVMMLHLNLPKSGGVWLIRS